MDCSAASWRAAWPSAELAVSVGAAVVAPGLVVAVAWPAAASSAFAAVEDVA